MTPEFVLAYVPRKMKALGVNDNYALAFRELVLAKQTITIEAQNQYYFLVGGYSSEITITSESGIYSLNDATTNEITHEHTGKITITSTSDSLLFLQFIIAIPEHKE